MPDDIGSYSESPWVIDIFKSKDAEGVVELYRKIYGEHYPVKAVYDPQELIRQSCGDAYRLVARKVDGEVVGHIALYRSSPPNSNLYEQGQLMVSHDYRHTDMASRLIEVSTQEMPVHYGLEQIWGEAVCNHLVTQQMTSWEGFYATALEVDLMPNESYAKAFSRSLENTGRVSALAVFRTFKTKAQTIYLPEVYEQSLQNIYSCYDFGHRFVLSRQGLPNGIASRGKMDVFSGAGVARITLFEVGQDFLAYIEKMERQAAAEGTVVSQIYLPLSLPCVGAVVDGLRNNGYFLGGPMPRWFDEDGLLMQKIFTKPNFEEIHLYTKQAKEVLKIIKEDWQTTAR